MKRVLIALTAAALGCAAQARPPGPPGPPPGGRYAAPPGYWAGGYRPVYPGWRGGYWGPRAGLYVGGPGYWGAWPYAWGAGVAWPYAVTAPVVVNAAPAPQVIVQPAPEAPASSYWYYCTDPAGYFPYVPQCAQPWMKVVPQLPGSSSSPPQLAP